MVGSGGSGFPAAALRRSEAPHRVSSEPTPPTSPAGVSTRVVEVESPTPLVGYSCISACQFQVYAAKPPEFEHSSAAPHRARHHAPRVAARVADASLRLAASAAERRRGLRHELLQAVEVLLPQCHGIDAAVVLDVLVFRRLRPDQGAVPPRCRPFAARAILDRRSLRRGSETDPVTICAHERRALFLPLSTPAPCYLTSCGSPSAMPVDPAGFVIRGQFS